MGEWLLKIVGFQLAGDSSCEMRVRVFMSRIFDRPCWIWELSSWEASMVCAFEHYFFHLRPLIGLLLSFANDGEPDLVHLAKCLRCKELLLSWRTVSDKSLRMGQRCDNHVHVYVVFCPNSGFYILPSLQDRCQCPSFVWLPSSLLHWCSAVFGTYVETVS